MSLLQQSPEIKNQFDLLSALDLISHMRSHHQDQALELVQLAQWHAEQARALAAERRALDVSVTLVEAEGGWHDSTI